MRRGVYRGAHLHVAPPISASFGTFLAETRKVRISYRNDRLQFEIELECRSCDSGGPIGVTIIAGLPVTRLSAGAARPKFECSMPNFQNNY